MARIYMVEIQNNKVKTPLVQPFFALIFNGIDINIKTATMGYIFILTLKAGID